MAKYFKNVFRSSDLRILAVMVAGIAVFGVVDGSFWRSLLSPTLAYRPAILFGLTLLFGWRGLIWSQLLFLGSFAAFLGWRGALFITPMYLLSHVCGLMAARKMAGGQPWLSREKSTLAFLAGAALAPIVPALLNGEVMRVLGIAGRPVLPAAVDAWLRGVAPILAIVPAVLVYGSGRFRQWAGFTPDRHWGEPIRFRDALELSAEVILWSLTLWVTVHFKARYGLNVTYLTFLPLLAFTLFRGMRLATLALAANAVIGSTLWLLLNWAGTLSAGDLRLLVSIYSITILVLAAVVDERKRGSEHVQRLILEEAVLAESERHFRTLANSAPVMIWVTGPDNLCTFVNNPWLEFSGAAIEQHLGNGWFNWLHPDDLGPCVAAIESAFQERRSFWIECRCRRADGEYRWILDNGRPLYNDGRFGGFIGSCVDITEQKLAAERLWESQAQLAYAQRLAKVGSFELNLGNDSVQLSEETLRILGASLPPPDFAACLNYVDPKDRKKLAEVVTRLSSGGAPVEIECRIIRANGEPRVVRSIIEGIRGPQGTFVRFVGACQDVTDQVLARERLQESEQRLQSAQDLAQVGSWHWDLDKDKVYCSDECIRIFGQSENYEPSLKALLAVIAPDDRERVAREIDSSLREARGCATEFQIVRANGELRTVTLASRVLLNGDGLPRHVFGACQDVTDMRRAQEEAFARQKLETLGALANGIAHDFNNLLGGVVSQAELALDELDSGAIPKQQLKSIREVAMRGSEIVRELMIYAGHDSEGFVPLDLSRAIEEILGLLKGSVSKRATIQTDLAGNLPPVRANSVRIAQLVTNLVSNASDSIGDRDGIIRVVTRRVKAATCFPAREQSTGEESVQLEISDTGQGVPRQLQSRVFEPFFSTKSGRRGLGLAIVDGIVRSLGGAVWLDSEPDKGTTIRVCLPSAEEDFKSTWATGSEPVAVPPPSAAPIVLLVEDEDPLRCAVSRMLGKAGFSVAEAADGTAALDIIRARHRPIDLLVLDITIPGASSAEVFREAARLRPEIPVIVTSAYAQDVAAESLQAEVRHFLRKPYRVADLVQLMRRARR